MARRGLHSVLEDSIENWDALVRSHSKTWPFGAIKAPEKPLAGRLGFKV